MRTFPKGLAAFRAIVEERGEHLRQLPFAELESQPTEEAMVESRRGEIAIIVMPLPGGGVRVVV